MLYKNNAPPAVAATADAFVAALLHADLNAARELIAPPQRSRYPSSLLNGIRPFLVETAARTKKSPYRFGANSVWYDAVRLTRPDKPASFLELAFERSNGPTRIVFMSFKGRP